MAGVPSRYYYNPQPEDRELTYRSAMLPLGTYRNEDGTESPGFAWPGMINEPINALERLGSGGFSNPQDPAAKQDMTTLLLSLYGGNALNPLARVPKGAIASGATRAEASRAEGGILPIEDHLPNAFEPTPQPSPQMVGDRLGQIPASSQGLPEQAGHSSIVNDPSLDALVSSLGLVKGAPLTEAIARAALDVQANKGPLYYGLRITESPLKKGSTAPESRQWYQDFISEDDPYYGRDRFPDHNEPLGGTSTVGLDFTRNGIEAARRAITQYAGDNVSLVGGDRAWRGLDALERVIRDANVIQSEARTRLGETLFSDTDRPSLMGAALASEQPNALERYYRNGYQTY